MNWNEIGSWNVFYRLWEIFVDVYMLIEENMNNRILVGTIICLFLYLFVFFI